MDFQQGRERAELKASNLLKSEIDSSLERNARNGVNIPGTRALRLADILAGMARANRLRRVKRAVEHRVPEDHGGANMHDGA
jgi:hypothetical protein